MNLEIEILQIDVILHDFTLATKRIGRSEGGIVHCHKSANANYFFYIFSLDLPSLDSP